jgi:hypothetical protein
MARRGKERNWFDRLQHNKYDYSEEERNMWAEEKSSTKQNKLAYQVAYC